MHGVLQPLLPPPPPKKPAQQTLSRLEPKPPAPEPDVGDDTKPAPAPAPLPAPAPPKPGKIESVEAMVESLYRDTRWIFDDLRGQMVRGEWEKVLRHIDNYLADPESPNRGEALLLKGACLEKLGRFPEARMAYRQYLRDYPEGPWTRRALQGVARTRR
jgi:hypothetical protein